MRALDRLSATKATVSDKRSWTCNMAWMSLFVRADYQNESWFLSSRSPSVHVASPSLDRALRKFRSALVWQGHWSREDARETKLSLEFSVTGANELLDE